MNHDRVRYRFGPLERRGLVAGWRGGQIAAVAGGLLVAVLALRSHPTPATIVVALVSVVGGLALACWPVAGRTGEEWAPTMARWWWSAVTRTRAQRVPVPGAGHVVGPDRVPGIAVAARSAADPKAYKETAGALRKTPFGGLALLSAGSGPGGGTLGVVRDGPARTYTAVLSVRGHSFALLGPADKERRVAEWASVLASLSRERSVIHRVQWLAASLPDDGRAVHAHLAGRSVLSDDAPARRSYGALLQGAGATTSRHEVLLAVQVRSAGPAARAVRAAGGGELGGCAVVLREADVLRRRLSEAGITVEGVLDPGSLAAVIRRAGDPRPSSSGRSADTASIGPSGSPLDRWGPRRQGWPWPLASEVRWDCLRTDGAWHATYWIAEWPRVDVGPDFLGPMLLGSVRRTVSVVMEPVNPSRAIRQVEQARTADLADSELRRRGGFLATARRSREEALVNRREEELADGHASFRFSGYVTVTAPTTDLLEGACEATEQAAGQCRLELRRLYGEQAQGLTCTLPLGRGLS
jgi:Putative type VII ESX secretion system translocon, EccE